jgi:hypothetical protein
MTAYQEGYQDFTLAPHRQYLDEELGQINSVMVAEAIGNLSDLEQQEGLYHQLQKVTTRL